MSHAAFVHLRARSGYSLLHSSLSVPRLVDLCRKHRMPAVALTDSDNLFGALEFSQAAVKGGVQPIVGCLLGLAPDADERERVERGRRPAPERLLFLVQNAEGYANLLALVSHAWLAVEPGARPQFNLDALEGRSAGLIALTGGNCGPVTCHLKRGQPERAEALLRRLAELLPGRVYVELQRDGDEAEALVEPRLIDLAYRLDLPLVATNEVLFADPEMHEAQDALTCIAEGALLSQDQRPRANREHRFKSAAEMVALFEDVPEAIANTVVVAQRCAFKVPGRDPILPAFDTGAGRDEAEELRVQAAAGLEERLERHVYTAGMDDAAREAAAAPYRERLAYELDVIVQMQFPGYFLIVADFIRWAKDHDIPVGPGRGSGAGSVVAWALRITDLDPLRFNLLFERFLNPERVSMPDFDIDFCQDHRDRVIRYVQDKYGHDRVAQIITFGKLQARAVLRDVGRVLGLPYGQVDRLSKLVPFNPANPPTLAQSLEMEPRLRQAADEDDEVRRLIDIALKLEGLPRNASTHAAGIVIGDRPLPELVPLYRDPRSIMPVSQFNMKDVEKAGLVKFDFLGLTTLTLLKRAEALVNQRGGSLDLDTLPLDDTATYALLSRGETAGVFQLESGGMRDALVKLKPDRFEDIIAMVSLYRPGPMDNIPRYSDCKNGREQPEYLHPRLEPILKETQGVIIYQEQVMEIARELAGYSLGGADLLRRAMGKKIKAEMDAQREVFVEGAVKQGINRKLAIALFEQVAKFASYGFNKSHAAAYALLAYQTAYLKANHPVEFFAASMTIERDSQDKLTLFRRELAKVGVRLLPPDVNASGVDFTVEDTEDGAAIRYALAAIRGVGSAAMALLVEEREAGGPYQSIFDLTGRCAGRGLLNKRLLEGLIKAGALDRLLPNRQQLCAAADAALRYGAAQAEARASSQVSLFGGADANLPPPALPLVEEWPMPERLQNEFEALGFYLSAHPLDGYRAGLDKLGITFAVDLPERLAKESVAYVKLAGMVVGKQERSTERARFAFVQLSDPTGTFEVTLFSELLGRARELLDGGVPLLVEGEARLDNETIKITASELRPLEASVAAKRGAVEIRVADPEAVRRLTEVLDEGNGGAMVRLLLPLDADEEVAIQLPDSFALPYQRRADVESLPGVAGVRDV